MRYREVPHGDVRAEISEAALATLSMVSEDLNIGSVTLRWFEPWSSASGDAGTFHSEGNISGEVRYRWSGPDPTTIFVRSDLDVEVVRATVAHEARHLWQLRRFRPPLDRREFEVLERDARDYEARAMSRLRVA